MLTVENVANMLKMWVESYGMTAMRFFIIINIIYLFLGMIMDTIPIIILTAPIFCPIAVSMGISPIHLGVAMVVNLAYGMITPPFGINLFVASGYSGRRLGTMIKEGRYFYIVGLALLLLISFCPGIYMWAAA